MIEKDLFMKYMTTIDWEKEGGSRGTVLKLTQEEAEELFLLVSSMSAGFDPEHWQFLQIFETPTEYVSWYSENNKDEGLFTRFCDWIENDEYVQKTLAQFLTMVDCKGVDTYLLTTGRVVRFKD